MEENKDKRVLSIELNNNVKHVSITGKDSDEQVVMRQELSEDDLEQATGGGTNGKGCHPFVKSTAFFCGGTGYH